MQKANQKSHRRIGKVDVTKRNIDRKALDDFLSTTRVFPSYHRKDLNSVEPYLIALEEAGFQVFRDTEMLGSEDWEQRIGSELEAAAKDGWVVVFLSKNSLGSRFVQRELERSRTLGAKLVPVIIEPIERMRRVIEELQPFDGTADSENAPQGLARLLLTR